MARFTKQERTLILREAHRHRATHRADLYRRKKALLLQKRQMIEDRPARETQQVIECDRDVLLGFIGKLKGAIRTFEGGINGFNGK